MARPKAPGSIREARRLARQAQQQARRTRWQRPALWDLMAYLAPAAQPTHEPIADLHGMWS